MNLSEVAELHYIAAIANLPSIMKHGVLSNKLARQKVHHSVAMPEIQERRKNKQIPGARTLHEYANLYFDAHNPMLSRVRERNDDICVLRVDSSVLGLPGVIIADRNAASTWVHFWPVANGLQAINRDRVFSKYWTHPENLFDEWDHKSEKCAEVLIPDRIEPRYIIEAYVANETARCKFEELKLGLSATIKNDIFF